MSTFFIRIFCQTYPAPIVNVNAVSGSPNATGIETAGNIPISLYEGIPSINIPIYEVKCGSLSLPISLSYYYNGFRPLQDASWVGLGWNLNVGGLIATCVQDLPDSSYQSGYNYGQYSIYSALFVDGTNLQNFLQNSYYPSAAPNLYDLAPDVYECQFDGGSFKFYWYNGKAYMFPYTKGMFISRPSKNSAFTITTPNGNSYVFGAMESTQLNSGPDFIQQYTSAWNLTMIISPDKKDTISLNYAPYTWNQYNTPYEYTYVISTSGGANLASKTYVRAPSIQAQALQSISCRTTTVNFVASSTARVDVYGTYPCLKEIDVIDKFTNNLIKKNIFNYEYLGKIVNDPSPLAYERLKLKQFKTFNTLNDTDSQTYKFHYLREYDTASIRPSKGTLGIDYWGYYNGQDGNQSLLSPDPQHPVQANRTPDTTSSLGINGGSYIGYGAMDTIYYPTGGYSTFHYKNNMYDSSGQARRGPGLCVDSIKNFTGGFSTPATTTIYSYGSGILSSPQSFNGPVYTSGSNTYNTYNVYNYASGRTVPGNLFYYPYVTETISAGNEAHKTDYRFANSSPLFLDISCTQKKQYTFNPANSSYTLLSISGYTYGGVSDTSFLTAVPYLTNSITNNGVPTNTFSYAYAYQDTYWKFLSLEQSIQYDALGDSISSQTAYTYDSFRNMISATLTMADGRTMIQRFKYPENYSSSLTGNMVSKNVLSPVIEKQNWLKYGSNNPSFIGGEITLFDQSMFKPLSTYLLETTSPMTSLSNETTSNGLYTNLISDAKYILRGQVRYDANNNTSTLNKAGDISISYIWDYQHSFPVAEVKNASQTDIAYTSFEADGKGNWSFTGTAVPYPLAPTGNKAYYLGQSGGSVTKSSLAAATSYIVSYWIKATVPLTITGTVSGYPIQGKTISGWTYFEHKVSGQTTITVSGTKYIDELRLYPAGAQMTTYTYQPLVGRSSQCDVDNRITYFDYDGYNRLQDIRDQDRNFIKQICYNYAGQAGNCTLTTYYNTVASAPFIKNDCISGTTGSSVPYTVPANTYSTTVSQDSAYRMALSDINANGQINANQNGSCDATNPTITCNNVIQYAGFVAKYTNTSTNVQYSFTISASGGTLGTIPGGTYNITVTKAPGMQGSMLCSVNCNNLSKSGATTVTFSNVTISNNVCNVLTIDAI